MPKLAKTMATKAAAEADNWSERTLLEPGQYVGKLVAVTAKEGAKGTYWNWEYDIVGTPNKQWDNTSLAESAIGRLGKVFEAFGVPTNTDTDDLIGRKVGLQISVRTIQSGSRKGEETNSIEAVFPVSRIEGHDDGRSKADDFGSDPDNEDF